MNLNFRNSDKSTHRYLQYYQTHLSSIRLDIKAVCEIGVFEGSSLKMWEEFFPNAIIYGVDINPACRTYETDRVKIIIADQTDPKLSDLLPVLDLCIDDGSHLIEHQLITFFNLFPKIREKGFYVAEDLHTASLSINENKTFISLIQNLVDALNYWPPALPGSCWPTLNEKHGSQWQLPSIEIKKVFPFLSKGALSHFDVNQVEAIHVYRFLAFLQKGTLVKNGSL